MESLSSIFAYSIKFFFLLTPFFVLSMFLAMTADYTVPDRRKLALRVAFSAWLVCVVLLFFGRWIFGIFGITVDAFRIGGGALLFLSAVKLVNGAAADAPKKIQTDSDPDIAVVPLAIPVTVGPATTGALMIHGADASGIQEMLVISIGLTIAIAFVGIILFAAAFLERLLKRHGIVILSKLTGLVLAALACEMIFTGIRNFLHLTK